MATLQGSEFWLDSHRRSAKHSRSREHRCGWGVQVTRALDRWGNTVVYFQFTGRHRLLSCCHKAGGEALLGHMRDPIPPSGGVPPGLGTGWQWRWRCRLALPALALPGLVGVVDELRARRVAPADDGGNPVLSLRLRGVWEPTHGGVRPPVTQLLLLLRTHMRSLAIPTPPAYSVVGWKSRCGHDTQLAAPVTGEWRAAS